MTNSTNIYLATFLSHCRPTRRHRICAGKLERMRQGLASAAWPYDIGDDPSFFSMRRLHGNLTWGICRQDVRNKLVDGDIVVFFSFRKETKTQGSYQLCSIATVERKVSQTDIWQQPGLSKYRGYCNLLIRPAAQGDHMLWEHYEPCRGGNPTHEDWLWRIARHEGLRKPSFDGTQKRNGFRLNEVVAGRPIEIAHNYVIFSSDPKLTRILNRPPLVASYTNGLFAEQWLADPFVQSLKRLTLDTAAKSAGRLRFLRTKNRQQPHRHIVWSTPAVEAIAWRDRLFKLTAGF